MEDKNEILKEKERWENTTAKKSLEKFPERKKDFKTFSNIPIKRLYTPADTEFSYIKDLGFPGEYPFTRGVQPTMYRGRLWTMRQYAGFGTAEDTNKRYHYLLKAGQTGLSVAFDLPTQIGYDSDDPMAEGEVGKCGVAIDTIKDMEILFDGIPLDKVTTSMTINSTCAIILAMYIAVAEKQGVPSKELKGTVQNDILKEYIARGTYIFPPEPSMRLVRDIILYCKDNLPQWNSISISGYHIREAGSTAVQEVAFTLANGIAYVKDITSAGVDVDEFAGRLSFFFNAHNNFLEEVAKFRAARRLWAKIMKERFNAKKPSSMMLRFHTQTAGCTLTAQQPENNVVRVTLQALSAVLGGTQSLHTNSRDEALALPTEQSAQIALRTQQIIGYESGVCDFIDPLGGSYVIESLTNEIEKSADEYIKKIDEIGGVLKAIEKGYIQNEIAQASYEYQKAIETKDYIVVGVNQFTMEEEPPKNILKVDMEKEEYQKDKLRKIKTERDNNLVKEKIEALKKVAKTDENIMPAIIEAVKVYASIGEISNALREVFGEFKEV
ncbi:MAG: methylmalonyl-CoA mutase family protein [Proteobacteria bacterium]|nr:methylmalonyl-CoA mutase family protein [Pseudomonadota bacterium]